MSVTITSHLLNGNDGSHAGGVPARLVNRKTGDVLFQSQTDEGGRLSQSVETNGDAIDCELVFDTAAYWRARSIAEPGLIGEIALRFTVTPQQDRVHMPIIISPNSYSTWKSS